MIVLSHQSPMASSRKSKHASVIIPWQHGTVLPACWAFCLLMSCIHFSILTSRRKQSLHVVQVSSDPGIDGAAVVGLPFVRTNYAARDCLSSQWQIIYSSTKGNPLRLFACFAVADHGSHKTTLSEDNADPSSDCQTLYGLVFVTSTSSELGRPLAVVALPLRVASSLSTVNGGNVQVPHGKGVIRS